MTEEPTFARPFLAFSDRITSLPVVHGSADFALAVRDELLSHRYDCLAVPLPPTFQPEVEAAVGALPVVSAVVQSCDDGDAKVSYVPVDPCQAVIRALRIAHQERIDCAFVDRDVRDFRDEGALFPDPYALKAITPEQFAAAVLAAVPRPAEGGFQDERVRHMAFELHKLELEHERILFIPSVVDWPWIREAYRERRPYPEPAPSFAPIETFRVDPATLAFFLAEVPYVTWLYEKLRHGLDEERSLSIDGVKELILEAKDRAVARRPSLEKRLTVKTLRLYLQYVRNLTLVRRRLRPDLITLVEAAKQVMGDDFAIELLETSREYPPQGEPTAEPMLRMGPHAAELPSRGQCEMVSRLPGQLVTWRHLDLERQPEEQQAQQWRLVWNPYSQCSWPPEDSRIESFNLHVREQARQLITNDLARVEKFTASIKDGLDIRETLRNWHTGDLYVREQPPARGSLEVVVFLFDVPADPARYPWRTTWFAEHEEESTLVFFATSYLDKMIGPGVAQARYGGAFFLFPPRPIPDVWRDPELRDTKTLEERLLAGAFRHSRERFVAVVSPGPLKASWRRLARRHGKQPIHLPLGRFSAQTVDRLRTFHVLNGHDVRSYAANFIRRPE